MTCPTCRTPTPRGHCAGCYRIAAQWRAHFLRYAQHATDCRAYLLVALGEDNDGPPCTCGMASLLMIADGEIRAERYPTISPGTGPTPFGQIP